MIAAVDVFLVTLILRLMDEIKDIDIDRELFPDRPVPSGRVQPSDIRIWLTVVIAGYIIINAAVPSILVPAMIVLGYSLLMFFHFFAKRRLRKSLLLSLASHNPVVALMLTHLTWAFAVSHGTGMGSPMIRTAILSGIMYWCVLASWEVSRKIRAAEDETAYVTYSRVLGIRGAVLAAATLQTIAFGTGLCLAITASVGPLYYVLVSAGYALVLASHVKFTAKPSSHTNGLRRAAEVYAAMIFLAGLLDYGVGLLPEVGHA
jgi:4-hydroxybenzoate polyprenyltransferase